MRVFKDCLGQTWTIDLNIQTCRALRAAMKKEPTLEHVDLLDYAGVLLSLSDPFFAADLLFLTVKEEAERRDVSAAAFGAALKGRALFDAVETWTAEYLDFFPEPTTKDKAARLVEKARQARETLSETICDGATKKLDEAARDAVKLFGALSSSNSPPQTLEESTSSAPSPSPTFGMSQNNDDSKNGTARRSSRTRR